jgi:predicted metal-dependent enzyme (double-stranded beta helix superfamily)
MTTVIERQPVSTGLSELVAGLRRVVARGDTPERTVRDVTDVLQRRLPTPDVLTAQQRLGSADGYRSHILHVEPDGSFSIVALVWRPGQATAIHDHVAWCSFGVIQGIEYEELFDENLRLIGENTNHVGEVSGFTPPGDIHRVRNIGTTTAISIHVYGADIGELGSSVRRNYG